MTSIQGVAVIVEEPDKNSDEVYPPVSENVDDTEKEQGKILDVAVDVKMQQENSDVAVDVKESEENSDKVCPPVPESTDVGAVEEEPEENPDDILAMLEADPLIASRYTDDDPEFAEESAAEDPEIPIVTRWYGKSRNSLERRTQEMDRKRQHGRTSEGDSHYNHHKRSRYDGSPYNNKNYSDYRHGHGGHHRSFSGPDHYNRDQRSYSGPRHDARDHRPYYGHETRDHNSYNSYNSGPGYYGTGHRSSPGSGNGNSRDHHGRRDDRRHDKCPPASER